MNIARTFRILPAKKHSVKGYNASPKFSVLVIRKLVYLEERSIMVTGAFDYASLLLCTIGNYFEIEQVPVRFVIKWNQKQKTSLIINFLTGEKRRLNIRLSCYDVPDPWKVEFVKSSNIEQ